jgi:uncharacterized protein YutE (UPF0331/DUF86 family)
VTDTDLVAKKLAAIETAVQQLRSLGDLSALRVDLKERRFFEHTLQIGIQAALDVAAHLVADNRLGEPRTNRELFRLLAESGWIPAPLAEELTKMVGFRNVLVHGYDDVDLGVVEDVVRNRLGDLLAFVAAVRERIDAG